MHRDIKPANLLIDVESKLIKICDFGQARINPLNGDNGVKYTLDIGSRWYKAPEIFFGCRNYNQTLDLWSLGCIIGEMIINSISQNPSGPLF